MKNMTVTEVLALIVLIGNALEKIAKAYRIAKAPNARQDEEIKEIKKHLEEVDSYLAIDKKRLDSIDEGNRATQRALLALLDHGIDGNNISQMQHAKEELQNHLINR
jgi:hypothetical protein